VIKLFKTVWNWLDDRFGISVLLSPMKHIAPQDSKWWYVFGSATLVAFIVQVASGVRWRFHISLRRRRLTRRFYS
jgi:Predicted ABC-type transport system involved in lysophospholipase L1 biosynthesis, permease component